MDAIEVLKHIKKAKLKINEKKCQYFQTSINFLGFRIGDRVIKLIPDKVRAVNYIPRPRHLKDIRHVLGAMAYYHRFIPKMSETLAPLYDLQKDLLKNEAGSGVILMKQPL